MIPQDVPKVPKYYCLPCENKKYECININVDLYYNHLTKTEAYQKPHNTSF